MHKPKYTIDDMRVFILVANLSSFSRVAELRQTSPSSISMAITRLEAQLGARLLQRTTRTVVLTDEGTLLLARGERLLEEFDEISQLFQQTASRLTGRLRVDVPLGMASGLMMQSLPGFLARHPELTVEVFSTDRRVDVIADGFDCVVRVGTIVDELLVCRPLGWLPLVNVVSPAYVEAYGIPRSLADLATHYLVNYVPNTSDQSATFDYIDGKVTRGITMQHRITVNNSAAYGMACRTGFGIAQLPLFSVEPFLATGELVQVMPDHRPAPMPINQLFPHRRNVPQRVRMFGDWLAELIGTSMQAGTAGLHQDIDANRHDNHRPS